MNPFAYSTFETPLGRLAVVVRDGRLVRLALPGEDLAAVLDDVSAADGRRPEEDPVATKAVRDELVGYFAGRVREFRIPLDLSLAHGFDRRALAALAEVPYGTTLTYGELAARAGNPRASRAAGHACATNPLPIVVPCHRVVRADGSLGNYSGGVRTKEELLRLEGVFV